MHELFEEFIEGVKVGLDSSNFSISDYMTTKTFLSGKPLSFSGHEYQEYCTKIIEDNPGCTLVVKKCSQIGMSQWAYHLVLSMMAVVPHKSVVLSMPSISFSNEVLKVRISNIIKESPHLARLIDHNNDSASVKQFKNGSILFGLGGSEQSKGTLLNRPVSCIVIDECDRQSRDVYTGYRSRQTHVPPAERNTIIISTPTASQVGVDREYSETGTRHRPLVKCGECGHTFAPDYYKDVVIPGYEDHLGLVTKGNISSLRVDEAYLECPECKKDVDTPNREVVWEVTRHEKWPENSIGVELDPWVAYSFISIPDLIKASVTFSSDAEFRNQILGKVAKLSDSSIDRGSFNFVPREEVTGMNVYSLDVGKVCTYLQGVVKADTSVVVTDAQRVKLGDVKDFLVEKHRTTAFYAGVMDQAPYADLAYELVRRYSELYSCVYVSKSTPMPELYKLKMLDKYNELVRQVSLNHTLGLDTFVGMLKDFVTFQSGPEDALIMSHFLSMRRIQDFDKPEGMQYRWVKTTGEDHYFHSYIYLMLAAKLAYAGVSNFGGAVPVVIKKLNTEKKLRR